jgi:hypothetical protein
MIDKLFFPLFIICSILACSEVGAAQPAISALEVEITKNSIIVNSGIDNVKEFEEAVKSGIAKEIVFSIELLRSWRFWPDEFVVARKIIRVVKFDNLREQYYLYSNYGGVTAEQRFKDYDLMKNKIFTIGEVNLANIRELEPGKYYVRVVVESKSIEEPLPVGLLMHFIPEVEMRLARESMAFIVRGDR